ncbi:YcaO-like family protein [Candidatus Enterococcus courvalinii]|uniref:YcaO-like family protein n=1 Tax=Candidatus Enterococcus courvalinii TaxID=2815329 RepID=A0ABS3HYV0_9ENTE|nr:YcaO-like family protein [Enterococcus sp. MSG2901]MBO0481260.1 YcaO-like family protein [Enterococcus sp. MSG2901]
MGLKINIINNKNISEPPIIDEDDFLNYQEMKEYLGYFNLIKKLDIVLAPSSECPLFIGNCEFLNVNYLFNYLLEKSSMSVKLNESIFAGGKGFSMYKAICSSLGETFERLMACLEFFKVKDKTIIGSYNELKQKNYNLIDPDEIKIFSKQQFENENFMFDDFTRESKINWLKMTDFRTHKDIYVPAIIILMYYSSPIKDETRIGYSTSGGLTSHYTRNQGVEHGLLEIIERHEINLSWYCYLPPKRIVIDKVINKKLGKYMDYIRQNNITFYRHNVDQENFHVITAMSFDDDMTSYSFNAGGGIDSDIEKAMVAALEEYTQAVNNTRKIVYAPKWLTSRFSNSVLEVNEDDDPKKFKTFYQAVSYYGLDCYKHGLDWYVKENEEIMLSEIKEKQSGMTISEYILKNDLKPVYSDLEVSNMFDHIYISKVYMKEFSPAFIAGFPATGHVSYEKYKDVERGINPNILPFP